MNKRLGTLLSLGVAALLQCLFVQQSLAGGGEPVSKKFQIISGYLIHFTSYVRWPESKTNGRIRICIYGKDPFGEFIDEMVEVHPTNNDGAEIITRRIGTGSDPDGCNLVFVSRNEVNDEFWGLVAGHHSLLLVSDDPEFATKGGIIGFYEDNKRLRIEINLAESRSSGLDISSELLKVSRVIKEKTLGAAQ